MRAVVIGAGIAGLAAAYRLEQQSAKAGMPLSTVLIEASERIGGSIMTYKLQDMVIDLGPDMFMTDKPAIMDLVSELGIRDRIVYPNKRFQRTFVARNGRLHALPNGFFLFAPTQLLPFVASDLFTVGGKLRILKDLLIKPSSEESDESLSDFVKRRLGKEALERVIQPLVGGIFTADPDKLSVKAALPRIWNLEKKYGSLIKGLAATRKKQQGQSGARYGLFASFDQGMEVLVHALESKLSGSIKLNTIVTDISAFGAEQRFSVKLSNGAVLPADAVVIAAPAFQAGRLVASMDAQLSDELMQIEYGSAAVINWLFRRSDIPHPLNGFGFVVPKTEQRSIVACSFTSVKFPDRVPGDRALLRVFVGGALQPDVYALTDEQIECVVWEDLRNYLGIYSMPVASIMSRYPKSMPQYNLGHCQRLARIETFLGNLPGIALAGNAYGGVGIPDCVENANRAADATINFLLHSRQRA